MRATNASQRSSLAHRFAGNPTAKHARYEACSLEDRSAFFDTSCRPITKAAEDDMEMLSDLVTWGERFLQHWAQGTYVCARCRRPLFASADKWSGPCVWPAPMH